MTQVNPSLIRANDKIADSRSASVLRSTDYQNGIKESSMMTPRSKSGGRSNRSTTPSSQSIHAKTVGFVPNFMRNKRILKRKTIERIEKELEEFAKTQIEEVL